MKHAEIPAPLSRPVRVADLIRDGETRLRIDPGPAEQARIAAFLGLDGLSGLTAALRLEARPGRRFVLSGEVSARVSQSCVVTGAPVETEMKCPVYREFDDSGTPRDDEELDPLGDDAPDIVVDGVIDPGEVVVETLALEIDPYPRAENAPAGDYHDGELGEEGGKGAEDHPFAALAGLLKKGE